MNRSHNRARHRSRVLLVAWLMVSGYLTLTVYTDTLPGPERARRWAEQRSDWSLSTTEFASYPKAYRVALYNVLPEKTKRRLWLEHLAALAGSRHFSAPQNEFIERLTSGMKTDPDLFTSALAAEAICAEATKLFPRPDDRRLFTFAALGTSQPQLATLRGRLLTLSDRVAALVDSRATIRPCDCAGTCDCVLLYSDLDVSCDTGFGSCIPMPECGCIVQSTCTGVCYCFEGEHEFICMDGPEGSPRPTPPPLIPEQH